MVDIKDYNKAVAYFTGAIDLDKQYTEAYYGRGVSYEKLKDTRKAVVDFTSCLTINPAFAPAKAEIQKLNSGK